MNKKTILAAIPLLGLGFALMLVGASCGSRPTPPPAAPPAADVNADASAPEVPKAGQLGAASTTDGPAISTSRVEETIKKMADGNMGELPEPDTINTIGFLLTYPGLNGISGRDELAYAHVAASDVNRESNGNQPDLYVDDRDYYCDMSLMIEQISALVADQGVSAILMVPCWAPSERTDFTSAILTANKAQVPLIAVGDLSRASFQVEEKGVDMTGTYSFYGPLDRQSRKYQWLAKYLKEERQVERAAVLSFRDEVNDPNENDRLDIASFLDDFGVETVFSRTVDPASDSFVREMDALKAYQAQALLIDGTSDEVSRLCRAAKEAGLDLILAGTASAFDGKQREFCDGYHYPGERPDNSEEFKKSMQSPAMATSHHGDRAYDLVQLIAGIIRQVGPDPMEVDAKLKEIDGYEGQGSLISFGSIGALRFGDYDMRAIVGGAVRTVWGPASDHGAGTEDPENGDYMEKMRVEADRDGDGLSDIDEVEKYLTDPDNPDTDGDGHSDGDEVKNGFNPNGDGKLIVF